MEPTSVLPEFIDEDEVNTLVYEVVPIPDLVQIIFDYEVPKCSWCGNYQSDMRYDNVTYINKKGDISYFCYPAELVQYLNSLKPDHKDYVNSTKCNTPRCEQELICPECTDHEQHCKTCGDGDLNECKRCDSEPPQCKDCDTELVCPECDEIHITKRARHS